MTLSIRAKLFFTLLFACALSVVVVQASMHWSFHQGLRDMIEQRLRARAEEIGARLEEQYRADGGWSRIVEDQRLWLALVERRGFSHGVAYRTAAGPLPECEIRAAEAPTWPRSATDPCWDDGFPRGRRRAMFASRLALLDAEDRVLIGRVGRVGDAATDPLPARALRLPLESDGVRIGALVLMPGPPLHEAAELRFRARQTAMLPIIALATLSLSALLAWWLSRWLSRPVGRFRAVARRLAGGQFDARAPDTGRDELAALGRDLNALAVSLEQNEQARRRWVADISHELRTPVSLLRAAIEAMQDGVRPLDSTNLSALHGDTLRLSHLIEDLYQLALSDLGALSYRKVNVDLAEVLADGIASFRASFQAAGLALRFDNRLRTPAIIDADPQRLAQLFANLLRNSVQYSDRGGALDVCLHAVGHGWLEIDFQDTAPSVAETERARLFERLYRVEPSRSRRAGGAGLGLAITKNIVEAHQGSIEALAAPQGGLWIRILLPHAS